VVSYLPCFRQWLITHLVLAFLPFQRLFTDSSWRLAPYSPHFSGALSGILPLPLCASFQFVVYCSVIFFLQGGEGQFAQGAMLVYPGGGWGNTA
jgi:hypothetical protein